MMRELLVRMYSVRFGDAILIVIPDQDDAGLETERHVLIDFGNVLAGEGGEDDVFEAVTDDIVSTLAGRVLDIYVMTHEHLDHVQGLPYAAKQLGKPIAVREVWLTASADPTYHKRFPVAQRRRIAASIAYQTARASFNAAAVDDPFVRVMLANNDVRSTAKNIEFLRELAPPGGLRYVHRTLAIPQPFRSARIAIWAPEEDTSDYYGRFDRGQGRSPLTVEAGQDADTAAEPESVPLPPRGVDAGAFYRLLQFRRSRDVTTLRQIDKASNNTSVVLLLEWEGWRLLFPGDAEVRSWKTMDREGVIGPVHFLKISHHGSHTGLPPAPILDRLLPVPPPDGRRRSAAVSTHPDTFFGVPDQDALDAIAARADLHSTAMLPPDQRWIDLRFPANR